MNDPLGNAFKSVIPEPPSTKGWVQGARRKRRNRQLAVGGALAAVVTAVAVPLALNLPQFNEPLVASPEPTVVSPTPTPTPTPAPSQGPTSGPSEPPATATVPLIRPHTSQPGADACIDEGGSGIDPVRSDTPLERGAERAWLCGDAPNGMGTVGPVDALTTDVDRIVDFFNEQPAFDTSDQGCGYEYSTMVRVVLEYADGSTAVLSGAAEGCSELTDGVSRKQSGEFIERMTELWEQQRQAMADATPTLEFLPQLCLPAQYSLVRAKIDEVVGGVVCVGENVEDYAWKELSADLAERVAAEVATATDEVQERGSMRWVVLATRWGDQIALEQMGDGRYWFRDGGRVLAWTPSDALAAELDPIFEEVGR